MTLQPSRKSTHFVIATWGTRGDILPFISMGLALQRIGHRVTFLGPAIHAQLVLQAGLLFHPLGTQDEYLAAINNPDLWDEKKGFGLYWASITRALQELPQFVAAQAADDRLVLLVHAVLLPAAALARARHRDIKIAGVYLAPSSLRSCHDPLWMGSLHIPRWVPLTWRNWLWRQIDARLIDPVTLPAINAERLACGLPAASCFVAHMQGAADLSITLFPAWFAQTPPDWPQPLCSGAFPLYEAEASPALQTELQGFLAAGDKPIAFTPGSANRHAAQYFECALQAVYRLKCRAIFLTPHRDQVPQQLPSNVLWQAHAPFSTLLPQMSALVHHGGIGTTAEALRAGVPQLVVPQAFDQFDNAARVAALGVGRSIRAPRLSPRKMSHALKSLRTREVQAQCALVAERFASDPSSEQAITAQLLA